DADDAAISGAWRRHADLGDVTGELLGRRRAEGDALSLRDVDSHLLAVAAAPGAKQKTAALRDLFVRASPEGARILAKLISGEMRIGLREGLVEEAIGVAFDADPKQVSRALMVIGDLGEVARSAASRVLDDARPQWFVPLRFMLATPVADAAEAVARMGEDVWVEDKYDGIRCQLHRSGERVALYSRDLKDVTRQFPEVIAAAAELPADVMLDGEVLAYDDGTVLPFQALQSRLGRVKPDAAILREVPVIYVAWDLLVENDAVLLDTPLQERRRRLEQLGVRGRFALAHLEPARGAEAIDRRFADARARNNEGLMLKRPDSPYTPGRRGLSWLKLKRPLDTLDVVVIGAEWGHGKRRGVLSDVTFAVRVDGTEDLVPIGKAYTGLTDAEIAEMTQLLLDITTLDRGHYRSVTPQIVLEVAFDRVQASTRHKSGFALRFPRIERWRHDKPLSEIDTLSRVRQLASLGERGREQKVDAAPDAAASIP
ncbi:MAG: ATP-dependent DNA ligase, partial [Candidatus Dormibacteraeota bacterium]|nr:ATP-dependent DNA ligase [Candidatus Dormibacteraeota bacterium]